MQVIETERLLIRPFGMEDVEEVLREIYSNREVWGVKSKEEVADGVMLMSHSPDDAPWAKRAKRIRLSVRCVSAPHTTIFTDGKKNPTRATTNCR